jgi:hypothetical protein
LARVTVWPAARLAEARREGFGLAVFLTCVFLRMGAFRAAFFAGFAVIGFLRAGFFRAADGARLRFIA